MRYVGSIAAKQSSAGGVTYVSAACTTGLLRTCNTLRIASLPVLRNDGGGRFADTGRCFAMTGRARHMCRFAQDVKFCHFPENCFHNCLTFVYIMCYTYNNSYRERICFYASYSYLPRVAAGTYRSNRHSRRLGRDYP
ncbi:MAG: hypothetical protein LBM98_05270 [Oscillospiraceae bacterium]|nr:hypothetical protein [Oscillospiraceae bacterium]